MKVKIKKLTENAKIPTKAHDSDFCYDVYATSCEEVEPGIWKYGIGLAFEIVRDIIITGNWTSNTGLKRIRGVDWNGHMQFEDILNEHELKLAPVMYNNVKISLDFRPRSSV